LNPFAPSGFHAVTLSLEVEHVAVMQEAVQQRARYGGVAEDLAPFREEHDIVLSMDGKGCWRDNVFVERFWRSLKYEEVYLRAYESSPEARSAIGKYVDFYNALRAHSTLDGCRILQLTSRSGDPTRGVIT
jgi:transposase InsO family protein